MIYRNIAGTGLNVSPICLGTFTFGAPIGEQEGIGLVHAALDLGINFFDTANMYEGYTRVPGSAGGTAEIILGKALAGKRKEAIVATKLGMKVGNEPEDDYTSPAAIRKQLDKSLQRLAIDVIDIYYLHRPDPFTPMAEILSALGDAVKAGKIRHYGISNYSARQLADLLATADTYNFPRPVICQPPLSLLKQDALAELIPLCLRENIAVAPYQVFQGGLLTGKYKRGMPMPEHSRKMEKSDWLWQLTDELYDRLDAIEMEAAAAGLSMPGYAIRWTLGQPGVAAAVIGVRNEEQMRAAILSAS